MTSGLGFDSYVAHGSDLGVGVTARLARAHPFQVAAIHLANSRPAIPPKPWSPGITEHFREVGVWTSEEVGNARPIDQAVNHRRCVTDSPVDWRPG